MNFENGNSKTPGVSAEAPATSPLANVSEDLTKNLKAEMNRKFSKINERLDKVLNHIERSQPAPVEETSEPTDVKTYIDSRFQAERAQEVRTQHERDYQEAVTKFPELDQNSDQFDEKFYALVDKLYTKRSKDNDPEALKEAVEVAAVRLGKVERLAQDKILKDEARRSRLISEGGTTSRESKKAESISLNLENLARVGIKNPDRLKERVKRYQQTLKDEG